MDSENESSYIDHVDDTNIKIITVVVDRAGTYEVYKNGSSIGVKPDTFTKNPEWEQIFGGTVGGAPVNEIEYGITLMYEGVHSPSNVTTMHDWLNGQYLDIIY